MRERDLIAHYFAPLSADEPGSFNLTDDAALLTPPAGFSLIVTTDSVIEGVHVPMGATPQQMAGKLVRRNLSDLAAMGANPWRYLLNLHLPASADDAWLAAFTAQLRAEQTLFGMVLAGGDTSRGGAVAHLTLTCLGLIEGEPLTRHGAQPGDDLYVSGTLGDAALGLAMLQQKLPADAHCISRYEQPQPRLALGAALRPLAHAALDISDGLMIDAARLGAASNVGLRIHRAALPLSPAAQQHAARLEFWSYVVSGGDDYELLFTAPASARDALTSLGATRIGEVVAGGDVQLLDEAGTDVTPAQAGWEY